MNTMKKHQKQHQNPQNKPITTTKKQQKVKATTTERRFITTEHTLKTKDQAQ